MSEFCVKTHPYLDLPQFLLSRLQQRVNERPWFSNRAVVLTPRIASHRIAPHCALH